MACHVRAVDPAVPDWDLVPVHTPHTTTPLGQMLPEQRTTLRSTVLRPFKLEVRGRAAQLIAGTGRHGPNFAPGCRPADLRTIHQSKASLSSLQLCKIRPEAIRGARRTEGGSTIK